MRQIDFDFSRVALGKGNERALAMRSHYFDQACRDFLGRHPEGRCSTSVAAWTAVSTGSIRRPSCPGSTLDYPEVMDLRERLYPPRAGAYRALRHSVDDDGWLQGCRASGPPWSWPRG